MCLKLFIHSRFRYCCILMTCLFKRSPSSDSGQKPGICGSPWDRSSLVWKTFYHVKKHLLPKSMFNIEQLIFFFLPCYCYQCLNRSLEHFLNSLSCFISVQTLLPRGLSSLTLFLEHFCQCWFGSRVPGGTMGRYNPQPGPLSCFREILSLIPSFATDLLGQPWTKTCH